MKEIITTALLLTCFTAFAQHSHSNSMFIRHDTTILKAAECEWVFKSLVNNNQAITPEKERSIPGLILQAIEKGKLIAIDPETNKPIPGKNILTWKTTTDTVVTYDNSGNLKYNVVQQHHYDDKFNLIRIFHDWNFDFSTSSMYSEIRSIELLQDIRTSTGALIGNSVFLRIYY